MAESGDKVTTEIDGEQMVVEVQHPVKQELIDVLSSGSTSPFNTDIEHKDGKFYVEPGASSASWKSHEFDSIRDSDFRVHNVEEGEHGPCVIIEKE